MKQPVAVGSSAHASTFETRLTDALHRLAELEAHPRWGEHLGRHPEAAHRLAEARARLLAARERWPGVTADLPGAAQELSKALAASARVGAAFSRFLAARTAERLEDRAHGWTATLTPEEAYRERLGKLLTRLGRQPLEGRLVGLLLTRTGPVPLGEAAATLGVTKAAVSKLANAMLERGDVKRVGLYSTREHAYELVDDAFLRDLAERVAVSRALAAASEATATDPRLSDPEAARRLRHYAGVQTRVAEALERVLAPEERRHEADLREHERENWDAIPARRRDREEAR